MLFSDNDGPYYWHIKSGTIQREAPLVPCTEKTESRLNFSKDTDNVSIQLFCRFLLNH